MGRWSDFTSSVTNVVSNATGAVGSLFGGSTSNLTKAVKDAARKIYSGGNQAARWGGSKARDIGANPTTAAALPFVAVLTPEGRQNLAKDAMQAAPMLNSYVPGASVAIQAGVALADKSGALGDEEAPPPAQRRQPSVVYASGGGGGGMADGGGGMVASGSPAWLLLTIIGGLGLVLVLMLNRGK